MELGFTEADVKKMDEFIKYIGRNYRGNDIDIPEMAKVVGYIQHANAMLRKMSDHIAEVVSVVEPEKKPSGRGKKK